MRIKITLLLVLCLMLTACTTEQEKPTEQVVSISVNDLKAHAEDYDGYYLHTLLRMLAEKHEKLPQKQLDENLKVATDYYSENNLSVTDNLKEAVVKAQLYEELVFLRILGKSYKDLEDEVKNGTEIFNVYQFVFLDGENNLALSQQFKEKLNGQTDHNEILKVYEDYVAKGKVEVVTMPYTNDTLPQMFEDVAKLGAGESYIFGDDTYSGLFHMHSKEQATVETLMQTYKQYVTISYPDTMELIREYIKALPTKYELDEDVETFIYENVVPIQ